MSHIVTKDITALRLLSQRLQTLTRSQFERPRLSAVQPKSSRSFSASSMALQEYLVVIPDFPGTAAKRAKAQPGHIEKATPLIDSGHLTYFGVTLDKSIGASEDHRPHINGSAIVMKAESQDAIRNYLQEDAYTKGGVWDVERAQIWPFKSG